MRLRFGPRLQAVCDQLDAQRPRPRRSAGPPTRSAAPPPPPARVEVTPPVTVERLVVVTSYFNPCGYRRIRENYDRFRDGIEAAGVHLFTAELAYDADPFQLPERPGDLRVRGRRDAHLLWQKERLLILLIARLPAEVDAIAWVDADVLFLNPDWPAVTLAALRRCQVVQMFEDAHHLHEDGRVERIRHSTAWLYAHDRENHTKFDRSHPGFAWAARASWVRRFGLLEHNVTGGGDTQMIQAFTGGRIWHHTFCSPEWLDAIARWSRPVAAEVAGTCGYVPGSILHLFHGTWENRRYLDRWGYLTDNGYDPTTDVATDPETGLLCWTQYARERKPEMVAAVSGYFAERREDD